MRIALGVTLLTIAFARADEPVPLLKPVAPGPDRVRVRVATSEEKSGFYHFSARVPRNKSKDEPVDILVAFECRPGKSCVSAKRWKSWGFEVPANRKAVLPELLIAGSQIAPRTSRKTDLDFRLTNIKLDIVDPPGKDGTVLACDMLLSITDLTKTAERAFEPRFYFADRFLELSVPASTIKRGESEGVPPAEPAVSRDATLAPVMGPMTTRGLLVFASASINGRERHMGRDGKDAPVSVTVSSTTNCPGGVVMSMGTARACGVELLEGKELKGTATDYETKIVKGIVKELRLGFQTGPDQKVKKDLVLKDVTVWIDKNDSEHMVWVGPNFLREHFQDPVYTCGSDGAWKLYGRVKPELLQDPPKGKAKK